MKDFQREMSSNYSSPVHSDGVACTCCEEQAADTCETAEASSDRREDEDSKSLSDSSVIVETLQPCLLLFCPERWEGLDQFIRKAISVATHQNLGK